MYVISLIEKKSFSHFEFSEIAKIFILVYVN